jgi:2-phosphoglycolate phosphatase
VLEAVLFDLDGTLIDTAPDLAGTLNEMRRRRGLDAVPLAQVRPFVSHGARGMLTSGFGIKTDDPQFQAMREEFLAIYAANICVDSQLFDGMEALLQHLEERDIAWGVVTNKFERLARPLLEALKLADRAAVIVGGDTCPRPKPYPDPLLHAAGELGVDPARTLYVGDDARDVTAARAAGMPVVVAAYGYLGDGDPPSLWGGDAILDSPREILDWIIERGLAQRAA